MNARTARSEGISAPRDVEEYHLRRSHRFWLIGTAMIGLILVMVFQLLRWQVAEHGQLVSLAQAQSLIANHNPVRLRGRILDAREHLLAIDIFEYEIWASPREVQAGGRMESDFAQLVPIVNMTPDEIRAKVFSGPKYVRVAEHVPQEMREYFDKLDPYGFHLEPTPKRMFPEGPLAAHILGFVNAGHEGFYGLEGYYDRKLMGEAPPIPPEVESDPILAYCHPIETKPGQELILTIDRAIQYMVEKELIAALRSYQAPSGTIIVMDPKTGAILAMANYPTYDPNHFASTPPALISNPAISQQYEPGSVFKVVTMAAGLDAGVVTPKTTIKDTGSLEVGGVPIYNWDRAAHGEVDMTDVLAQSLNVGAAYVSTVLGKERFYNYVKRFGFGRLTDVDLAGEVAGNVNLPGSSEWHESDLGTNSFGQGIAVTPLQMVRAVAAVANRGLLMRPYVVAKIIDGDNVTEIRPTVVRRAISADTAETLTAMMTEAVERETALALVPGYSIAGKTGTAEIPTPGGYKTDETIASFIGFAPARDPKFIVLVKIDRPKASPWGSKVAAPVFRKVAEQLFAYLQIPPDDIGVVSR